MKKLFIGCGILVLILIGIVGYIGYRLGPLAMELHESGEAALQRLQELDREHPFDPQEQVAAPLDGPRFAAALELRAVLADDMQKISEQLEALNAPDAEGEKPGVFQFLSGMFRIMIPVLGRFEERLRERQMSWPEFAFHTRLLWACLIRVDAGVGPPELEPLQGSYDKLLRHYDDVRAQNKQLPPLTDLIGTFPTPLLNEASTLIARDLQRVKRGLEYTLLEHLYMQPVLRLDELTQLHLNQQTEFVNATAERQAARERDRGVAEPAGAPEPLGKPQPAEPERPGDK